MILDEEFSEKSLVPPCLGDPLRRATLVHAMNSL